MRVPNIIDIMFDHFHGEEAVTAIQTLQTYIGDLAGSD